MAPVEGEALAVVWGLWQTRYFTLGCNDLLVVSDHQPLKKLLGDRTLDKINNSRLLKLKQRTFPWYFEIDYLPGIDNPAADATSRNPSGSPDEVEDEEPVLAAAIDTRDMMDIYWEMLDDLNGDTGEIAAAFQADTKSVFSLSWEDIAQATKEDRTLSVIVNAIEDGSIGSLPASTDQLSQILKYSDSLYVSDGVAIYRERAVIPVSLRQFVMDILHLAHQGVSGMEA